MPRFPRSTPTAASSRTRTTRRALRSTLIAGVAVTIFAACASAPEPAPPPATVPSKTQSTTPVESLLDPKNRVTPAPQGPIAPGTYRIHNVPPTLTPGTRQSAVLTLKHQLGVLMRNDALIKQTDNFYDPLTAGAVANYQQFTGLPRTGIVDEATWRMIFLGLHNNLGATPGYSWGNAPKPVGISSAGIPKQWTLRIACPQGDNWAISVIDDTVVGAPERREPCKDGIATVPLYNKGIIGHHTYQVYAGRTSSPSRLVPSTHRTFITLQF